MHYQIKRNKRMQTLEKKITKNDIFVLIENKEYQTALDLAKENEIAEEVIADEFLSPINSKIFGIIKKFEKNFECVQIEVEEGNKMFLNKNDHYLLFLLQNEGISFYFSFNELSSVRNISFSYILRELIINWKETNFTMPTQNMSCVWHVNNIVKETKKLSKILNLPFETSYKFNKKELPF